MKNTLRSFVKNSRGAALVEFTILLPVLIALMAGMTEFGRALQQNHTANKGVKNAARYLARVVDDGTCPPRSANWTTQVNSAKNLAQRGSFDASAPYSLSNWQSASDITVTVTCFNNASGGYRGEATIPLITVSTSFAFNDIGMLSLIGINALTVKATHQQMYIGG